MNSFFVIYLYSVKVEVMITFKAIIVPGNKRQDGVYPVKIRVTFKGVSRRLPTTLVCYPADLTRALKIKNATILSKADDIIRPMRDAISDISPFELEARDVDWVVDYIKAKLAPSMFKLDFFVWAEQYLKTVKPSMQRTYTVAINLLKQYCNGVLDINDITSRYLNGFIEWSESQPKMNGINRHATKSSKVEGGTFREITKLAAIFNAAKKKYNDDDRGIILIPRSPFDNLERKRAISNGQKNLGVELMQQIILDADSRPKIRFALDLFVVSFALMGANVADLYNKPKVKDGVWKYNRAKTAGRRQDKAEMRVFIPKEAQSYIGRLKGHRGEFLGLLQERFSSAGACSHYANIGLKKWCEEHDVDVFTMYAARHSFASIARSQGVEKATVDECLAHVGDYRIADIYAERDWEKINEANGKVISLFEWME